MVWTGIAFLFAWIFVSNLAQAQYELERDQTGNLILPRVVQDPPWTEEFIANEIWVGSGPENNYVLLSEVIKNARSSIYISVYQLKDEWLAKDLADALDRGVKVFIFLEGRPVGKLPNAEMAISAWLSAKGAFVRFYTGDRDLGIRNFAFLHEKITIVDGEFVVVGSANYGPRGQPKSATVYPTAGNREWQVVFRDQKGARIFGTMLRYDIGLPNEWVTYGSEEKYTFNDADYKFSFDTLDGNYHGRARPLHVQNVPIQPVVSPENSIGSNSPMLKAMASTRYRLDIEQLDFETFWGAKRYNPPISEPPMLVLVKALARSGRIIRILLNDEGVFRDLEFGLTNDTSAPSIFSEINVRGQNENQSIRRDNAATIELINRLAHSEGLAIEARFFDYKRCNLFILHNKGMIVDLRTVMVGSLNWGEGSLKKNREAGIVFSSEDAARYYQTLFEYDWRCSFRM